MRFFQRCHFFRIPDSSRHDPVHQRTAERTVFIDICTEPFFHPPLINILIDAFEQLFSIVVDKLAGQHENAWFSCLIAMIKHLRQFCREAGRRKIFLLTGRIVDDACLCRVGNDDLQIVAGSHFHHGLIVFCFIRVQTAADAGNHTSVIHLLPFFTAAQVQGVKSFLFINHLCKTASDGLNEHTFSVPVCFFVGKVKPVVYKRA